MTSRTERVIGEYKSAREKALIEVSSNANKMHGGSSEKVIKIVSTIVDNINACNERFCVIPIWILSDPLPGQWGYDSLSCEWSMVECLFSGSGFEFQFLSAFLRATEIRKATEPVRPSKALYILNYHVLPQSFRTIEEL